MSPVCRRKLDFPLMLGPVMMSIWSEAVSTRTSFGMYFSPGGSRRSITGWRPSTMSRTVESFTSGRVYSCSRATRASDE